MMVVGGLDMEKNIDYFKCRVCEKTISDGKGNVMYPTNSDAKIEDLQIWCKDCSLNLSKTKGYQRMFWDIAKLNWSEKQWEEILKGNGLTGKNTSRIRDNMLKIINRNQQHNEK